MSERAIQAAIDQHNAGHFAEAERMYRAILATEPNHAEAVNNLAILLAHCGRMSDAAEQFALLTRLKPNDARALTNLGYALHQCRRTTEALSCHQAALKLDPQLPDAHNNLAVALRELDRPSDALSAAREALRLRPEYPQAMNSLSAALYDLGQRREAEQWSARAIALWPQFVHAHENRAMALLALGDFDRGWREYEWREQIVPPPLPQAIQPARWDGSPLNGQTILLLAEQGFGDAIWMIRYASVLAGPPHHARVVCLCRAPLVRLFARAAGVSMACSEARDLPPIDLFAPLMSLPLLCGTNRIPAAVPYFHVAPASARPQRISPDKLNVGICWASGSQALDAKRKSMQPQDLAPLASVEGVAFVRLQKDVGPNDAAHLPPGMHLVDDTAPFHDFADTAAMIDMLDLVITIDTAVAHLAGALGKPTFTMLPFPSEWRWMEDRADSPWYPSMRLFRQRCAGDWSGVVEEVRLSLAAFVREHRQ